MSPAASDSRPSQIWPSGLRERGGRRPHRGPGHRAASVGASRRPARLPRDRRSGRAAGRRAKRRLQEGDRGDAGSLENHDRIESAEQGPEIERRRSAPARDQRLASRSQRSHSRCSHLFPVFPPDLLHRCDVESTPDREGETNDPEPALQRSRLQVGQRACQGRPDHRQQVARRTNDDDPLGDAGRKPEGIREVQVESDERSPLSPTRAVEVLVELEPHDVVAFMGTGMIRSRVISAA